MELWMALWIPFIGTMLGSAMVFFMKDKINPKIQKQYNVSVGSNKVKVCQERRLLLTNMVVPILPYLLSFAAGAMLYVVVEELIPESQEGEHSNIGTIGVAIGFALMMLLDVALG